MVDETLRCQSTTQDQLIGHAESVDFSLEQWGAAERLDDGRCQAARDLPGDPSLRFGRPLRRFATLVVLRDAWMARNALEVLDQQRRDAVHEVFRNVVQHAGPQPPDPHEDL